jgi:hypothetical protein
LIREQFGNSWCGSPTCSHQEHYKQCYEGGLAIGGINGEKEEEATTAVNLQRRLITGHSPSTFADIKLTHKTAFLTSAIATR